MEYSWDPHILETLMGAPAAPEEVTEEQQALWDIVADEVDSLPEPERSVIEALFWKRESYRRLAVSQFSQIDPKVVTRIRRRGLDMLQARLKERGITGVKP